jgi:NADH dehydrogenase
VLWAAGVQGTKIAESLGVELDPLGRVKVQPDLSVPGHPEVFVVGDAAHVVDPKTGHPVPGVAQGAIQGGRFVADLIRHDLQRLDPKQRPAFHYFDKGSMATIGRGKAVASIKGKTIGGFFGWLAWGLVHIIFLVGFRTKLVVMLDWIWNYFSHERGARILTGDPKMSVKKVIGASMYDDE